jgi:rubredoxin
MDEQTSTERQHDPTECPLCGSVFIEFLGFEDGGGDYGLLVDENWYCGWCNQVFVRDRFELLE